MILRLFFFSLPVLGSFFISWIVSAILIRVSAKSFFSRPRLYTPSSHHKKNPTLALGGIAIISGVMIGLWWFASHITPEFIILSVAIFLFGAIGLFDDCVKLHNNIGISAKKKALLQCFAAGAILFLIYFLNPLFFLKSSFYSDTLWFYAFFIVWNLFILIGTTNAVNLTDGLDMLAVLVVVPICGFLFFVACNQGNEIVALLNACLIGALSGFACFNRHPALLWMGDVGSLSIGACIALSALLLNVELFLPLVAIVLVVETITVIMQIISVKLWNKKVFKMAPVHHHFELCGYSETTIVRCACFISVLAVGLGIVLFLIIK